MFTSLLTAVVFLNFIIMRKYPYVICMLFNVNVTLERCTTISFQHIRWSNVLIIKRAIDRDYYVTGLDDLTMRKI